MAAFSRLLKLIFLGKVRKASSTSSIQLSHVKYKVNVIVRHITTKRPPATATSMPLTLLTIISKLS